MQSTWDEAQDQFPGGALITATYPPDRLNRIKLIERLIETMGPRGCWAVQATTEEGERMIQVLFEDERDARVLGDTLHARQCTGVPGYSSHRCFEFTGKMHEVVANALKG